MSTILSSELRSDVSSAYYTTARLVGQSCTDDILSKSTKKVGGMTSQATSSSSEDNRFKNTRMCVFFQKGACSKGEHCTYAHSTEQLKSAPNLLKTRLCQDWLNGRCVTPDCRFAHGRQELRFTFDYYKTKLCHFWQNGGCTKGSLCRHAHGENELRPMPPEDMEPGASSSSASTADEISPQVCGTDTNLMNDISMTAALAAVTACADLMTVRSTPKPQHFMVVPQGEIGTTERTSENKNQQHGRQQHIDPNYGKPARHTTRGTGPSRRESQKGMMGLVHRRCAEESYRSQLAGKHNALTRYVDFADSRNPRINETENLVKAMRLAQAARDLANKSNDIIRRVAESEAMAAPYLVPLEHTPGSSFTDDHPAKAYIQNMRHSVACPSGSQIPACAGFTESRHWDYRHSAPECDLESLAKRLLPLLTEHEELQLTSKLSTCR